MSDFRLKVFYEVQKSLNFSKAAEVLCITQPAVSKHINALENDLGVALFSRTKHGVKLTKEGEIYADYAREILSLYDEAKFKMNEFRNVYKGIITIGASTTIAQYILPEIVAQFIKKHPHVSVNLLSSNTEDVENMMINDKIDLGFIEGISGKPQLKYIETWNDELICVCNPHHPLAGKENCRLAEILQFPWVIREQGSGSLDVLFSRLKQEGISKNKVSVEAHLGSTESIKSYLEFSDAVGFLSVFSVKNEILNGKLRIVDIKNFVVSRKLYALEHQSGALKNLPKLFLQFIKNNFM